MGAVHKVGRSLARASRPSASRGCGCQPSRVPRVASWTPSLRTISELPSCATAAGELAAVTDPGRVHPPAAVPPQPRPSGPTTSSRSRRPAPGARLRVQVGAGNAGDRPVAGSPPSMCFRPGQEETLGFAPKPVFMHCEIQGRVGRPRAQVHAQQRQSHGRLVALGSARTPGAGVPPNGHVPKMETFREAWIASVTGGAAFGFSKLKQRRLVSCSLPPQSHAAHLEQGFSGNAADDTRSISDHRSHPDRAVGVCFPRASEAALSLGPAGRCHFPLALVVTLLNGLVPWDSPFLQRRNRPGPPRPHLGGSLCRRPQGVGARTTRAVRRPGVQYIFF